MLFVNYVNYTNGIRNRLYSATPGLRNPILRFCKGGLISDAFYFVYTPTNVVSESRLGVRLRHFIITPPTCLRWLLQKRYLTAFYNESLLLNRTNAFQLRNYNVPDGFCFYHKRCANGSRGHKR